MRTLAIDPGERRVGLALSDAGGHIATPHDVLEVPSLPQALPALLRLIEQEGIERLVVGLPLNMDGTPGPQAERVRKWARQLQRESAKALVLVDERLSTFAADQHLSRRRQGEKLTHKGKKRQRDAVAAAILLQEFLDGSLPPLE